MADTHMRIQNVILYKRYVRDLIFNEDQLKVVFVGGRSSKFKLHTAPTAAEIAAYESELEDR